MLLADRPGILKGWLPEVGVADGNQAGVSLRHKYLTTRERGHPDVGS